MRNERGALGLLAGLLALAAARVLLHALLAAPEPLCDPCTGPPTLPPDLARDGVERLAWLPGLGPGRAERVVRERAFLGAPLSINTLTLVPGIGETSRAQIAEALQEWNAEATAAEEEGRKR